jgi:hypothetical protein
MTRRHAYVVSEAVERTQNPLNQPGCVLHIMPSHSSGETTHQTGRRREESSMKRVLEYTLLMHFGKGAGPHILFACRERWIQPPLGRDNELKAKFTSCDFVTKETQTPRPALLPLHWVSYRFILTMEARDSYFLPGTCCRSQLHSENRSVQRIACDAKDHQSRPTDTQHGCLAKAQPLTNTAETRLAPYL